MVRAREIRAGGWALGGVLLLCAPALGQSTKTLVYGVGSTSVPKQRTWNGSSWSSETSSADVGSTPRWVIVQKSPTRNETICAVEDSSEDLNLMVHNGTSWGSPFQANDKLQTSNERPFYFAYEQTSGDGLVAYRVQNNDSSLYYRTWNGSSWSGQNVTSYWGAGKPRWVKLVPKAGSDEIMVLVLDTSGDLSAMIWNGSSFTNNILLENDVEASSCEGFDAVYESTSGRCLVAWSEDGNTSPEYRIWSGASWGFEYSLPSVGGNVRWLRLAADPASNKIIAMTLDGSSDVNATVWSGSSWGSVVEFETSAPDDDRRAIDVTFEPDGERAIAMYGRSSQNNVYYRVYSGSSWGSAVAGPAMSQPPSVIQLAPSGSGQEILALVRRKSDDTLCFMKWNGTSLGSYQTLSSDLASNSEYECFMITGSGGTVVKKRVASWCEVEPN